MLTVGSLFAGIGGFDLGFERAGMRTLWQVEQNEFCRRVLERHFPNSQRFNDVREVTGCVRRWEEHGGTLLEYVDVLCGGFPCQDISLAGKGAGLEGERSGLWSEYARLIGELRPRYVVVENVSALLGRGLGTVLGDLAACGYDAEWDCIPAAAVGAPHRRDRVWLVAYPRGEWPLAYANGKRGAVGREARYLAGPQGTPEGDGEQRERCGDAADDCGADVADPNGERREGRARKRGPVGRGEPEDGGQDLGHADVERLEGRRPANQPLYEDDGGRGVSASASGDGTGSTWWAVEPDVGRVAYGVPARVDRLAALGNALVPQIAEWIGRRIIEAEGGING